MGVITTADEKLESAKEHINAAIEDLSEIVVNRCWGHDEYVEEAKDAQKKVFADLLSMRTRLEFGP